MVEGPLVAIVDDDESVRESVPDLLRALGFAACAFDSAEALLASAELGAAACLVVDVFMPGMSGSELQRELRQRGYAVPIVFISARADEVGAVPLLPKPFSETALLDAIRALTLPPRALGE